ncbi:hypothetical protein BJ508DRAFT_415779 [Ascobolus immersus RN42]|uniref:Uncharacterized protein n=1 Tax=Ascobolus immersus RN42 TaxID=1160509 RepID=A0A3N4I4K7_ASCIM|nr:hypothetical protein BJ508DRAFT_415779 [Ascobolus immersus RN42]
MGSALSFSPKSDQHVSDTEVLVTLKNDAYTEEQIARVIEVAHDLGSINVEDSRSHGFYICPVMLTFHFKKDADLGTISKTLGALDGVHSSGRVAYATKGW